MGVKNNQNFKNVVSVLTVFILLGLIFSPAIAHEGHEHTDSKLLEPDWTLEQLVNEMEETWMGGTVKKEEMTGEVREFYMHVNEIQHELKDGVVVEVWGYGLQGEPVTIPGPTLRVQVGDLVKMHVKNTSSQPHSIHSHGITSLDELNDGVPHISGAYIMPGETFTYEFVVTEAGTHWYHCHVQTSLHQDMGMYGALIVEENTEPIWDKEFVQIIDEWDTERGLENVAEMPVYDYFTVNGKSGAEVPDMVINEGEIARVRLINAGFQSHSLHLHGTHFVVTHKDGYPLPKPYEADTINIAPGETYDVFVKGRDGVWPWHDHNSLAVTDNGVYPGGMIMHLRGLGEDPFDLDREVKRIPVEGAIHRDIEHAKLNHGDPQFVKQKMAFNSKKWATSSTEERKQLHEENVKLAKSIGGIFDEKAGKWTFPETVFEVVEKPEPAPPTSSSPGIELGAMKPPIIEKDAVQPLEEPGNAVPFNPVAPAQPENGELVEVELVAQRAMMEVSSGVEREVWTFNGQVPAPSIRVNQGDTVRITLSNKDPNMTHGLDFHAGQMDMGTFHKAIEPGGKMTFEFKANYPGVFYYHCSADPVIGHIANGMFGAVIVDPPGYEPKDKEFVVIQHEWYQEDAGMNEWVNEKPVAVAFNGVPQQYMSHPLVAKEGDEVRFYFVNAGINDFASWHIIGEIFDEVYLDGNPKNKRTGVQSILVGPGDAVITDLNTTEAGDYLMLTHQMNNAMRGGLGLLRIEE